MCLWISAYELLAESAHHNVFTQFIQLSWLIVHICISTNKQQQTHIRRISCSVIKLHYEWAWNLSGIKESGFASTFLYWSNIVSRSSRNSQCSAQFCQFHRNSSLRNKTKQIIICATVIVACVSVVFVICAVEPGNCHQGTRCSQYKLRELRLLLTWQWPVYTKWQLSRFCARLT